MASSQNSGNLKMTPRKAKDHAATLLMQLFLLIFVTCKNNAVAGTRKARAEFATALLL